MSERVTPEELRRALDDPAEFVRRGGIELRPYQTPVLHAVLDAVTARAGGRIAVMFPRQSGKNELQAQIEAYLLALYAETGGEIVKVAPTWRPQAQTSMRRLKRVLNANPFTSGRWASENGYCYRLGSARILFYSAAPGSNIVGATASLLLEVDEAQSVDLDKFDREIAPMAASTNAARVFWGTPYTADTLLGRELRAADAAFTLTADEVAACVPAYGAFVAREVARLGRSHPHIRTQYYGEEIDTGGGMFPHDLVLLLASTHPPLAAPRPDCAYAFLVDVGGESFTQADFAPARGGSRSDFLGAPRAPDHDATALTIVEVDLSTFADPIVRAPTYRCVHRRAWVGEPHASLYTILRALADHWQPQVLVIDATGIGAGLASFLTRALTRTAVLPFVFTTASKSALGYDFLTLIETGRWKEHAPAFLPDQDALQALFFRQMTAARCAILPNNALRWGVPTRARDPLTGSPLHDDLLLSAALVTHLEGWTWRAGHGIVPAPDPLKTMRGF